MASGSLGNLTVDLLLEAAQWAAGLNKAEHQAAQFADALERKFNKLAGGVGDAMKGLAAGLAAGFAADKIVGFVNDVQKAADSLGELSERTGASIEFLAEMSVIAATAGSSVESLAAGMGKFAKATVAAFGNPESQPAKVFEALEISVKKADGTLKTSEELYKEVARAMGQLEDSAVKSAMAQILFGKAGAEQIPVMNALARASDELKASTKTYGEEIKKLAPIAGELEEQQAIAATNSKTYAAILGQQLIPYFSTLLKQWNDLSSSGSGLATVGTALVNAFKGIVLVVDATVTVLMSLGTIIFGILRAFDAFKGGDLKGAFVTFSDSLKDANAQGLAFEARAKALLDPLSAIPPAAEKGAKATDKMTASVVELGKAAKEVDLGKFKNIYSGMDTGTKAIEDIDKALEKLNKRERELFAQMQAADNAFYSFAENAELAASRVGMTREQIELYNAHLKLTDLAQRALKMDEFAEQWERLQKAIADKKAREDYLQWLDTLENEWHRAFDSMFDDTEGGWEGMLKSLKASFKKLLLDYIYQQFAKPFFLNVVMGQNGGSMFGGAGAGGGNNFLGSLLDQGGGGWFDSLTSGSWSSEGGTGLMDSFSPGLLSGNYFGSSPWLSNSMGGAGVGIAGIAGGVIGGWGAGALGAGERGVAAGQQWGGMLAGAGMMIAGPIGAAVGAALGVIIGKATDPDPDAMRAATFGSLAGAEGVTKWTGQSAFGSFGFSQGEWLSDSDMDEQMGAFIDSLETVDNAFASFMSEDQIARVSARLNEAAKRYELGMEHGGVTGLAAIAKERLAIITKEIDAGLGAFVEAFEGNTEDLISIINSFLSLSSGEGFNVDEIIEAMQPQSMMEAYQEQAGALDELIANADGSAESMSALASGMANFQVATVAMVVAIDEAAASIHAMFTTTADSIRQSMMSEEERYTFLQERADDLFAQLMTETDPAAIQELAGRINDDINAAWGMLDEGQQSALGDQYLERLAAVDQLVADKMAALRDVVIEDAESAMVSVADRLDALFARADTTAQTNETAANINLQAAQTPVEVVVVGGGIVTDSGGG